MIATVYAMRDAGESVAAICARIGVSDTALRRARRNGIIDWPLLDRPHSRPRVTHCKRGHDLSVHGKTIRHGNFSGGTSRRCVICHAARTAEYKQRVRQETHLCAQL